MRKVQISLKVLKWLVTTLIEASKIRGNTIKRWSFEEFYGTLKYNESGRYVSFIAIHMKNRSIIITPELSPRGGWNNIAYKIAGYIYEPNRIPDCQNSGGEKRTCPIRRLSTIAYGQQRR